MGAKKKGKAQQHVVQSMGQMVSKAALVQLQEPIRVMINQLGQRLALKQAETTQVMFTRIVAIEKVLMDKGVLTQEDLQNKVADIEDARDNATRVTDGELTTGDIARVEIRTKEVAATNYDEEITRLKVMNSGSGNTLGTEVEKAILGMKVGETREVTFADNKLNAEIKLNRLSRPVPPPAPAVQLAPEPTPETTSKEGTDASPADQVQG